MDIKIQKNVITTRGIENCLNLLEGKVDNPETVLQSIGYVLLDTELFPDELPDIDRFLEEGITITVIPKEVTRGDIHRAEAVLIDDMDSFLGGYNEFEVKSLIQQIGKELIWTELYPISDSE